MCWWLALLWRGSPHSLLQHLEFGTLTLISSPALLAELQQVLSRPKFDAALQRSGLSRDQAVQRVRRLAETHEPARLAHPVCRDPRRRHAPRARARQSRCLHRVG